MFLILYFYNDYSIIELFNTCYKSSDINEIIAEKNIFYEKDNTDIQNINCNKLCIIDKDNKTECITKEELLTVIKLPSFRKYNICINGSCMTNESVNILNGKSPILLENASSIENKDADKKYITLVTKKTNKCGSSDEEIELQFLSPKTLGTSENNKLYIHEGIPKDNIEKNYNNNLLLKDTENKYVGLSMAKHNTHDKNTVN